MKREMARSKSTIDNALGRDGFSEGASCAMPDGTRLSSFKKAFVNGELSFLFGVFRSARGSLFVRLKVGVTSFVLEDVFGFLGPEIRKYLCPSYAQLGWGIGDAGASGFDPSPDWGGSEFVIPTQRLDESLALVSNRIPIWAAEAGRYLSIIPIYDFYRFDARIDAEGWREMIAVLKVLRGENYVGLQLLRDLVDEAAGRRPLFGDFESAYYKAFGLRRDDEALNFFNSLLSRVRDGIDSGVFEGIRKRIDDLIR